MKIRMNTQLQGIDSYLARYGKKPQGRGLWTYRVYYPDTPRIIRPFRTFEYRGTFAETRKRAFDEAKASGGILVELMP